MGNAFLERLGVAHPIIQAPMGGGPTTPALVAAVSNAGGLGFIAAGYLSPNELRQQIRDVRQLTTRPFGVNAFVDLPPLPEFDATPMREALRRWMPDAAAETTSAAVTLGSVVDAARSGCPSKMRSSARSRWCRRWWMPSRSR
jgi:nitronate monooxygenase